MIITKWCKACEKNTPHDTDTLRGLFCLTCTTKANRRGKNMSKSAKKSTAPARKGQLTREEKASLAEVAIKAVKAERTDLTWKTVKQIALTMYVACGKKTS